MLTPDLRAVFATAFGRPVPDGPFSRHDVEEWDSLGHVKLVLQLEVDLGVHVEPTDIQGLHQDFATVAAYVNARLPEAVSCRS